MPSDVFQGVEWSTMNTLQSQINRIKCCGLDVEIGETYFDVDTRKDLDETKSILMRTDDGKRSRTLDVILTKFPVDGLEDTGGS